MPRLSIPVVEVTAPDGTKSFWAAYSVSHREAVAAVKHLFPSTHRAELSGRRLPPGLKFDGARPGDLIKLGFNGKSERRAVSWLSGRSPRQFAPAPDLKEIAAQLVAAVRGLPPGKQRQEALREIGRLQIEMHALLEPIAAGGSNKSSPTK